MFEMNYWWSHSSTLTDIINDSTNVLIGSTTSGADLEHVIT